MSASNSVSWRYIAEVTFGTTPGTPTMVEVLRTGGTLDGKTDTVTSKAVRSDRMTQGIFRTGQRAEGTMDVEFAYGQFDDLLQACFCGTWTSAAAVTSQTDIDAATGDDSFNDASSGFVAAGFVSGMWVLVSGFATAANNGLFKLGTVTAGKLLLAAKVDITTGAYTASPNLTTEAAGASVTIKNAGMLRNGTTGRSFSWEQAHTDVSQYFIFTGMRLNDWTLTIAAKALVTANFTWMGKSFDRAGSAYANAVTAANSNSAFNTTEDIIGLNEGNAALTEYVSEIKLMAKNNLSMIDAVANLTPPDITYGQMDLTGELSLYLASTSGTIIDKYIDFTETSCSFVIKNGSSPYYYILTIPAYKYSGGIPEAGALNGQSMVKLPFTAYKGSNSYQIQIDKISTT